MNDVFGTSTRRAGLVDGVLGVVLAVVGAAEVLAGMDQRHLVVALPAVVVSGLGLTQRRRRPDLALVIVVVPIAIAALFGADLVERFTPFVTGMVAMASMAIHSPRPTRSPSLLAVAASIVVVVLRLAEFPADLVYFGLQFALAWGAGFAVRRQLERVVEVATIATRREAELAQEVESALAAERSRMAGEIHDIIGHGISMMVVHAGAAEQNAERPDTVRSSMDAIQEVGRAALADMARLLSVLHSDHAEIGMAPQPGVADIGALCASVGTAASIDTTIEVDCARIPASVGLTAYRIVQEALTNAVRHAPGGAVTVVVQDERGSLDVRIENEAGTGPPSLGGSGRGLLGLEERVRLFGGSLRARPRDDGGYEVSASIPFAGAAHR